MIHRILVDTVIWADHLGRRHELLVSLLAEDRVVTHPYIVGEVALGSLKERETVLGALNSLGSLPLLDHNQVMYAIERRNLASTGIGYVDAHLVSSTLVTPNTSLWTRDNKLRVVAERLGISAKLTN